MADSYGKLHFAMFPWLAFGHMIPFLELSKCLALKGHKVTFISTPRNIDRLPKLPQSFADASITFLKISFPRVAELPANAEATTDIRIEDMVYLKKAFDGLETELTEVLENSVPDWIVYDFCPHWLPRAASKPGISRAFFSIVNAWFISFMGSSSDGMINSTDYRTRPRDLTLPPKWVTFENSVAYRLHEADWFIAASDQENVTGVGDLYRLGKVISDSDVMIFRHCPEFEGQWLQLLEELHHKPVIPLGLMPPPVYDRDGDRNETWEAIKAWLDTHKKDSVLYVALGSEVTLSQEQINELAVGLEMSGLPFFWVLRNPPGSSSSQPEDTVELLEGFEERVKGRGVVWRKWVPQVKILSHGSVGGFLTHCGWGSLIEGVMFGHPLIMLPFVVDQGLNARVFANKQIGMEIPRNEVDGSYTRDSVSQTVKSVMIENDGKILRLKAKEMSEIFRDTKLHNQYLENAIQFLENFSAEH